MILDSGNKVKKNQKMAKEMSLFLANILNAANSMKPKNSRLIKVGNSSKLFATG
jgi:hypothetical protein